jgi:polyisoprenoid-binding protein YceI
MARCGIGAGPSGGGEKEKMTKVKHSWRRWLPVTAVVGLLAIAGFQPASLGSVLAQDVSPESAVGVLEAREGLPECAAVEPGAVPTEAAAAKYALTSEQSVARYRVMEELASVGANEVVGETTAIIGHILFDENGAPLPCSRFDVDLRTLQTDEARRDNFLRGNTLETDTYPLATFVLRQVEGLDGALPEGEAVTITLIGDLTFHGVTQLTAWEATVTRAGETVTGSATTNFVFPDFEIEKPIVGPVVGIGDEVTLEVELAAAPAA